ncbi:hypothetical protein [Streptomyces sp. NPDC048248]|uniref:hypothetical protein n=1 Tax=Streptomyces sp. NPDC048248 TaxID=3365523 RepID=UPI003710F379
MGTSWSRSWATTHGFISIISDPAQNPHSREASTQYRLKLSKAKVVFLNGGGYDDCVGTMLADGFSGGGRQRVRVAQVPATDPRVLL